MTHFPKLNPNKAFAGVGTAVRVWMTHTWQEAGNGFTQIGTFVFGVDTATFFANSEACPEVRIQT